MSERPQPLKAVNRFFEGREAWQIVTMTASSVLAIVWTYNLCNAKDSIGSRMRREFFRWARRIPYVRRKIEEKMSEINNGFKKDVQKRLAGVSIRRELPENGLAAEQITEEIKDHLNLGEYDWKNGQVSGTVYHINEDIVKIACDAYALTAYTNPLHPDVFPGINKMESEVVSMAVKLFNGDDECCGTMTTGGTESIVMACKAWRDYAYSRGISNPQMVLPTTAHPAFDKAAQYLGVSVKTVPIDPVTCTVKIDAMRKAISRRTCMIVGSAPNFPYGTIDDIAALSDLAVEYDVPLHVDACLGGFIAVFMREAGHNIPDFDFKLPGVCSISADTHKYGYAPKGTSVVLYRKHEYRHHQYTVTTEWPGGVYGSPAVNGSRAGGLIAACWATMLFVGRNKYVQMTDEILRTRKYIEAELRKVNDVFIFGTPGTTVIAMGSKKLDIFKVGEALQKKGWSLNALQYPSGIQFCITHAHTHGDVAKRFVEDLKAAVVYAAQHNNEEVQGKMAIYGVAQKIPDRSLVSDITKNFIDSLYYLPTGSEK